MSEEIRVSRKFVEDFELVANYYGLRELGEYEAARNAARADLENAIKTFAVLAGEIKQSSWN